MDGNTFFQKDCKESIFTFSARRRRYLEIVWRRIINSKMKEGNYSIISIKPCGLIYDMENFDRLINCGPNIRAHICSATESGGGQYSFGYLRVSSAMLYH